MKKNMKKKIANNTISFERSTSLRASELRGQNQTIQKNKGEDMNDKIFEIFNKLDKWRHLPNYQLERRADIFFSLYLKEVIEEIYQVSLKNHVIPEFPVRIGTINSHSDINKSYKIDYVLISEDVENIFFVELKTDIGSRRKKQDTYLVAVQEAGLKKLLEGLKDIFRATSAKRKYYHLFTLLEEIGLVKIPSELHQIVSSNTLVGINKVIERIEVFDIHSHCHIVYIQPSGEGEGVVNFEKFGEIINKYSDELTKCFRKSLQNWSEIKAGQVNT